MLDERGDVDVDVVTARGGDVPPSRGSAPGSVASEMLRRTRGGVGLFRCGGVRGGAGLLASSDFTVATASPG